MLRRAQWPINATNISVVVQFELWGIPCAIGLPILTAFPDATCEKGKHETCKKHQNRCPLCGLKLAI